MGTQQYCTFYLDECLFGVEVQRVQEVIRYHAITGVPRSAREVSGLMNLRGQIVIAIDLRCRLGMPDRDGQTPMNVVVNDDEQAVSLLVDRIGDVIDVDSDSFEPPPETLQGVSRELILGVHKLERNLLHILDVKRCCSAETVGGG